MPGDILKIVRYDNDLSGYDVLGWMGHIIVVAFVVIIGILYWNWRLYREIRKREEVEVARQESEARYRILIDQGFNGIFVHDHFVVLDINKQMAEMVGRAREELIGTDAGVLFERSMSDALHGLSDQGATARLRLYVRHKDGSVIPVEAFSALCRFHGTDATIVAMRDMRAQDEAERILRANYNEMEQRVQERTSELDARVREAEDLNRAMINILEDLQAVNRNLNQMAVRLEAANRELESFSYSVSHDLRAPLRAIDGFSQAIEEDYTHLLDDQGRHYLQRIRHASRRMGDLIDDMLNLSRLSRRTMQIEQVNLSHIAYEIGRELKEAQPARQAEFVIAPDVVVQGDERLLTVAMTNLLTNAWKFTSSHSSARIEFGIETTNECTACYVKDDGVGFDMAYAGKLFGAFQRLHHQAEFPGAGIGLATVQRIIHRHGGQVWAKGEVEKGATFFFSL